MANSTTSGMGKKERRVRAIQASLVGALGPLMLLLAWENLVTRHNLLDVAAFLVFMAIHYILWRGFGRAMYDTRNWGRHFRERQRELRQPK